MSRLEREQIEAIEDTSTNPNTNTIAYKSPRDSHGFRTDGGNRKARRAAWAKTRKIRDRFLALTKEAAR